MTKDEIVRRLNELRSLDELDSEREEILNNHFKNKESNEISTYLMKLKPEEVGGLTAISGFYYQFLVTIEYIIEMLENKWDYILMEHHDDIVAVRGSHIKFIQVKTSQNVTSNTNINPAKGLYNRTSKVKDKQSFERNNSWVDKLISNAMIAPKSEGFTTEFELYTSYYFMKTKDHDFDFYTSERKNSERIPKNDHLLNIISKPAFNKKGELFSYEVECGEKVEQLLSRFNIRTGLHLHQLEIMKNNLCAKLNKWVFKDVGENYTMKIGDLNAFIGLLFSRCTKRNAPNLLVIDRITIEDILSEIRIKSTNAAKLDMDKHESSIVLERIFNVIQKEYADFTTHSIDINGKLYDYKDYMKEWISDGEGDIKELIERYLEGTIRTSVYSDLDAAHREAKLKEFLKMVLILNLSRDSLLRFDKNKGLLTKSCEETDKKFSFLSPGIEKDLQYAINFLENEFALGNIKNHIASINGDLYVILQNYFDPSFEGFHKWEKDKNNVTEIEELDEGVTLLEVPTNIFIVPGSLLSNDFKKAIRKKDDIKTELKGLWGNYERSR